MTTIKLTQQPYICSGKMVFKLEDGASSLDGLCDWYEAMAEDAEGNTYLVVWALRDDFDPNTGEDEGDACDWEHPVYIEGDFKNVTKNVIIEW